MCLILSAFFAGSETALLRLNLKKIERSMLVNPSISLQALRELTKSTSKLLVTILLGNNVVNIFGTAAASSLAVAHFGEEKGLLIATVVMTFCVLIFCEILPKTIAANNSSKVSALVSLPLYILHKVLTPMHWIFDTMIEFVIKKFQVSQNGEAGPSSYEELIMLAKEVKHNHKKNGTTPIKVIGATAKSSEIILEEIMVNRAKINFCPVEANIQESIKLLIKDKHSRLPVYDGNIDNIVGIVHLKDLIIAQNEEHFSLREICHPAIIFSERTKLFTALTTMQNSYCHMAIIKDEFGVTQGLITLEDILEELVGEIRDEFDEEEAELIKKINDDEYLVNSSMLVSDFNKRTGLKVKSEKRDTLGGLVFNKLDGQVDLGKKINDGNFAYEITKVEGQIIKELKLRFLNPS